MPIEDGYDVAQICPNGHVVNKMAASYPEFNEPFCATCGEATITACPNCKTSIRGYYASPRSIGFFDYDVPSYCFKCGSEFPWTESKKRAANELFAEEWQDETDRQEFRDSVEQIARDTPQAQVASKRISRLLGKIRKETASAVRDILVDIASDAVKKLLIP